MAIFLNNVAALDHGNIDSELPTDTAYSGRRVGAPVPALAVTAARGARVHFLRGGNLPRWVRAAANWRACRPALSTAD